MVMRARYVARLQNGRKTHIDIIDDECLTIERSIKWLNKVALKAGFRNLRTNEDLWKFCDFLVLVTKSLLSEQDKEAAISTLKIMISQKLPSDILDGVNEKMKGFFDIPADIRAGLNLSGLWMTQLLTSAVVIANESRMSEEERGKKEHALLRCVAILYGLGRPGFLDVNPEEGIIRARMLLENVVDSELMGRIIEILQEDKNSDFVKSIRSAFEFVTSYNRMMEISKRVTMSLLEWDDADFDSKEKWESIDIEDMDNIVTKTLEMTNIQYDYNEPDVERTPAVFLADVSGIQNFIMSTDRLQQMQGASSIIDQFMKNGLVLEARGYPSLYSILVNQSIPLESVVTSGGGNFALIVRSDEAERLSKIIPENFEKITKRAKLIASYKKFSTEDEGVFVAAFYKARQCVNAIKNDLSLAKPEPVYSGIELRCDSCRTSPATRVWRIGDSEYVYCNECYELYKMGNEDSFRIRYEERRNILSISKNWKEISKDILEFIAGNTKANSSAPRLDLALVKADANLAGRFMAGTATLSAIVEKNILLTQNLRKSIEVAQKWLAKTVLDHLLRLKDPRAGSLSRILNLQLYLGGLYAGGDDLVLIGPAQYIIPYALKIGLEFVDSFGGVLGMSFGIVTFDPKSPFRLVIEAAEHLLEFCKEVSRSYEKEMDGQVVIDYEIIRGLAAPRTVINEQRDLWERRLIQRPLIMNNDLHDLFQKIVKLHNENVSSDQILDELVGLIVEHDYYRRNNKDEKSFLRKIWNVSTEILSHITFHSTEQLPSDSSRATGLAFSIYMMGRQKSKQYDAEFYRLAGKLSWGINERMGLIDMAILIRILMGGH